MRFLLRRLGFFVLTLWAAMTLNFFIPRMMPGNPAQAIKAQLNHSGHIASPAQLNALLASYGFDPHAGLLGQYLTYLKDMVTFNWGVSIGGSSLGTPVRKLIAQALPWTLGLVGTTTVLAFVLGTLIGVVAGWRRGGLIDGIEMDQQPVAGLAVADLPLRGNDEAAAIDHAIFVPHHAGKRRFDGIGDKDAVGQILADRHRALLGGSELPDAVEIDPVVPRHLRTRVIG